MEQVQIPIAASSQFYSASLVPAPKMEAHLQAQETPMEMDRTIWDRKRDLGYAARARAARRARVFTLAARAQGI